MIIWFTIGIVVNLALIVGALGMLIQCTHAIHCMYYSGIIDLPKRMCLKV